MHVKRGLWRALGRVADAAVHWAAPASVTWLTSAGTLVPVPPAPPGPYLSELVRAPVGSRNGNTVVWARGWLPAHVPPSSPLKRRPQVKLRQWLPGSPRRHLLVVTGFNMAWAGLESKLLGLGFWLERGYRVAMLGLPLHGTGGVVPGAPSWPSSDFALTRDAVAAATQDVREAVAFLRAEAALPVVSLGISLGAWPVALAGTGTGAADALVALSPMVDYGALLRDHAPPWVPDSAVERAEEALRPLSPFGRAPSLAAGRTLVLAASDDAVTPTAHHAEPLARHFGGTLERFDGSHLLPWGLAGARRQIDDFVRGLGLP